MFNINFCLQSNLRQDLRKCICKIRYLHSEGCYAYNWFIRTTTLLMSNCTTLLFFYYHKPQKWLETRSDFRTSLLFRLLHHAVVLFQRQPPIAIRLNQVWKSVSRRNFLWRRDALDTHFLWSTRPVHHFTFAAPFGCASKNYSRVRKHNKQIWKSRATKTGCDSIKEEQSTF